MWTQKERQEREARRVGARHRSGADAFQPSRPANRCASTSMPGRRDQCLARRKGGGYRTQVVYCHHRGGSAGASASAGGAPSGSLNSPCCIPRESTLPRPLPSRKRKTGTSIPAHSNAPQPRRFSSGIRQPTGRAKSRAAQLNVCAQQSGVGRSAREPTSRPSR